MNKVDQKAQVKYTLLWRTDKSQEEIDYYKQIEEYYSLPCAGEVRQFAPFIENYQRIPIVISDGFMSRARMRFVVCSFEKEGEPLIRITSQFMFLYEHIKNPLVWHEVGHVHHAHAFDPIYSDNDKIREERTNAAKEGRVQKHEFEADCFAASQVGKRAVLEALTYVYKTRPKSPKGSKTMINDLARREIGLRIAKLRKMKNKKSK